MSRELPQPERSRWQPLRAGLIDVFYYDQEEFWFRDGRLLLRGNNGTGKSKLLAMTLPFLLDGELAPHRVEPDADPNKRMEWNLLLGGEHPHPERLGYTWLEFGRRDDDGVAAFCTLGCGLKAVSGRRIAGHWFFITRQRVGEQLALVDATGVALTRDRLEDALGSEGRVHRTATAYRRAVDETLFGLGVQRYTALVDLMIRIRAPQLSKRPSERALSDALTEALPPLDQALVADVAEAFHSLEEDRAELQAMVEARDAATGYLDTYRRYAQVACRRRAARPRQAQTLYDRVSRERSDAEAAHEAARTALAAAEDTLTELRDEAARLRARDRALRESPEARSARELEGAEREAQTAAEHAREAEDQHRRTLDRIDELRGRKDEEQGRLTDAVTALADARATGIEAADAALVAADYRDGVDNVIQDTPVPELRRRADVLIGRQARATSHVRELLGTCGARRQDVARARGRLDDLTAQDDEIARRRDAATRRLTAAGAALIQASSTYLDEVSAFALPDPATALAELELWADALEGPNPLRSAVESAGRLAAAELARADAEQERRRADAGETAAELGAEIDRLEAGQHDAPQVPHTRDPRAREGRPGAPLWQLVEFRDQLPDEHRAGSRPHSRRPAYWTPGSARTAACSTWARAMCCSIPGPRRRRSASGSPPCCVRRSTARTRGRRPFPTMRSAVRSPRSGSTSPTQRSGLLPPASSVTACCVAAGASRRPRSSDGALGKQPAAHGWPRSAVCSRGCAISSRPSSANERGSPPCGRRSMPSSSVCPATSRSVTATACSWRSTRSIA